MESIQASSPSRDWLLMLRRRFVELASKRVPEDAVEDLVQDAMAIVVEKAGLLDEADSIEELPPLAWCFQVLRNTVGNFYQKQRSRSRESALEDDMQLSTSATPFEALHSKQLSSLVEAAMDELAVSSESCGRYLRAIIEGSSPARIAEDEAVEARALYRRIYRCREKLRQLLEKKGVLL